MVRMKRSHATTVSSSHSLRSMWIKLMLSNDSSAQDSLSVAASSTPGAWAIETTVCAIW